MERGETDGKQPQDVAEEGGRSERRRGPRGAWRDVIDRKIKLMQQRGALKPPSQH